MRAYDLSQSNALLLIMILIFQVLINTHIEYLTFSLVLYAHRLQFLLMIHIRVSYIIRIWFTLVIAEKGPNLVGNNNTQK